MKKFLAFLVAIIVVVSLGLTTYYFLRNDEVINFTTKEVYCNINDVITLEDLGKTVTKQSKNTTYDYNAGGEEVTSRIKFNVEKGYYVVGEVGGDVELVIKTSNKHSAEFKILVHVGNGTADAPFNISSQAELERIGGQYPLDSHFALRRDIALNNSFAPIGYNMQSESWVGFSGKFDGKGHTISGLNLNGTGYTNAGLFYSLDNAEVRDLYITGATINGAYDNAGALAGVVTGTIDKVQVINANITNTKTNSKTGALVGVISGENSLVKLSGATGTITLGSAAVVVDDTTESDEPIVPEVINVVAGGLIGEIIAVKVQATFAEVNFVVNNANGHVGGFAGIFAITADNGTIQQSYSMSTSEYANFAGFIAKIDESRIGDNNANINYLKYLVGNYAVVPEGKSAVNEYNTIKFENFYDVSKSNYFIVPFTTAENLLLTNDYIFYAVSSEEKTLWDNNAWYTAYGKRPVLRYTDTELAGVSADYLAKDRTKQEISDKDSFISLIIDNKIENKKLDINNDINLEGVEWTPVELYNSIIDFKGHKITGLNLTKANAEDLGLFSVISNSTVKNLILDGVRVSADATNVGALAGRVNSRPNTLGDTSLDNIMVNFESTHTINQDMTYFGGLVGVADDNTIITNARVSGIRLAKNNTNFVGGLAGVMSSGAVRTAHIDNAELNGINVAGVVAVNGAALSNLSTADIQMKKAVVAGGITTSNLGSIMKADINVNILLDTITESSAFAGVATSNDGTIEDVTLSAQGIIFDANSTAENIRTAGISVVNNGTVTKVYNRTIRLGTFVAGKNHLVGGMFVENSGNASECIVKPRLYGNTVAGIVVDMKDGSIDQVLVADIDRGTNAIAANEMQGDKYVAGVAYSMSATSTITNVQTMSSLVGSANDTRVSLIVLHFPNGAVLKNSTINSSVSGYGTFYRETWKDFNTKTNAGYYHIYGVDSAAGSMQSVVINTDSSKLNGKSLVSASNLRGLLFGGSYQNTAQSSYVKATDNSGFNTRITFIDDCYVEVGGNWDKKNVAKTMTFDLENVWSNSANGGIQLSFINR